MTSRIASTAALLTIIAVGVSLALSYGVVGAQSQGTDVETPIRISAQRLDSGSVRFGLRVRDHAGQWSEPVSPRSHQFNPSRVPIGRWLVSSSLILEVDASGRGGLARSQNQIPDLRVASGGLLGHSELRIRARVREDRRIEFAVQQRTEKGWSDDILPRARTMPAFGDPTNWLSSSPVTVAVPIATIEPEPAAEVASTPIIPVLRSGWRTGSLQYAATVNQGAKVDSILTVHSEEGPQMQVGCFGDVRRVQFVGVPFRTAGASQLTIDGDRFTTNWSASTFNGGRVLRPADSERLIERLGQAQSASLRVDSAAMPTATLDLSGLLDTPVQANIDQCGNYTEPTWRPMTEAKSGTTNDGATYLVYYPQWSPLQRHTQTLVDEINGSVGPNGQPTRFIVSCGQQRRSFQLGNLPGAEGNYTVRSRIDGQQWMERKQQIRTTGSGNTSILLDTNYERLRKGASVEYEIHLDPVVRLSFNLSALFGTPVQANIDNCRVDPWTQAPTYVPIVGSSGRPSATVSYRSLLHSDGTVFTWSESTLEAPGSPNGTVSFRISCQSANGLDVSLVDLDSLTGLTTDVRVIVDGKAHETSQWRVFRYTRPDGELATVKSPEPGRLMAQLQEASAVTVEIPSSVLGRFTFDIEGMVDSPLQDNLDECGSYKSGETRRLPRQYVACTNDTEATGQPNGWMARAVTLVAEAYDASSGVWPGFDPTEHQVVLAHRNASGQVDELLTIGVAAPELLGQAKPLSTADTPFCSLSRVDQLNEQTLRVLNQIPNFSFQEAVGPKVNGLYVMIVDLDSHTFNPLPGGYVQWREFVMHEFFHHYQQGEWTDVAGRNFKTYVYSAGNLELAALEDRALRAAATAEDGGARLRAANHFAAIRQMRSVRLVQVAHDEGQERIEGTARYLERRLGLDYAEDGSFKLMTDPEELLRDAQRHGSDRGVRHYYAFLRFYETGAVILRLLDLFGIDDYVSQIEAGKSPAQVLHAYLGVSQAEVDGLVAEARAAYDPDNELPALAIRLAAAAAREDWDGPTG